MRKFVAMAGLVALLGCQPGTQPPSAVGPDRFTTTGVVAPQQVVAGQAFTLDLSYVDPCGDLSQERVEVANPEPGVVALTLRQTWPATSYTCQGGITPVLVKVPVTLTVAGSYRIVDAASPGTTLAQVLVVAPDPAPPSASPTPPVEFAPIIEAPITLRPDR